MIENFKEKIPSLEEFLNSLDNLKLRLKMKKSTAKSRFKICSKI